MKDNTITILIFRVLIRALGMLFLEHRKYTSFKGTGNRSEDRDTIDYILKDFKVIHKFVFCI